MGTCKLQLCFVSKILITAPLHISSRNNKNIEILEYKYTSLIPQHPRFSLDTSLRNSFCLRELSILMGLKLRWRLVPRSWDINLDIVRHERQDWKCINYWPHSHVYQSPGHSFPFNQIKSLAKRLDRWESLSSIQLTSFHFSDRNYPLLPERRKCNLSSKTPSSPFLRICG